MSSPSMCISIKSYHWQQSNSLWKIIYHFKNERPHATNIKYVRSDVYMWNNFAKRRFIMQLHLHWQMSHCSIFKYQGTRNWWYHYHIFAEDVMIFVIIVAIIKLHFPVMWKIENVIFIPKSGKDFYQCSN